jgi:chromosome segregation ATPase
MEEQKETIDDLNTEVNKNEILMGNLTTNLEKTEEDRDKFKQHWVISKKENKKLRKERNQFKGERDEFEDKFNHAVNLFDEPEYANQLIQNSRYYQNLLAESNEKLEQAMRESKAHQKKRNKAEKQLKQGKKRLKKTKSELNEVKNQNNLLIKELFVAREKQDKLIEMHAASIKDQMQETKEWCQKYCDERNAKVSAQNQNQSLKKDLATERSKNEALLTQIEFLKSDIEDWQDRFSRVLREQIDASENSTPNSHSSADSKVSGGKDVGHPTQREKSLQEKCERLLKERDRLLEESYELTSGIEFLQGSQNETQLENERLLEMINVMTTQIEELTGISMNKSSEEIHNAENTSNIKSNALSTHRLFKRNDVTIASSVKVDSNPCKQKMV